MFPRLSFLTQRSSANPAARPWQDRRRRSYQPAVEYLETRCLLSLPAPWTDRDMGDVGSPGSANYDNNVYTVQGPGADIFDSRDAFHFVYQPLAGDGDIAPRVTGV